MAERQPDLDRDDDAGAGQDGGSPPTTPGWVKVFGAIGIVLVLLIGVLVFAGGGSHGPARHTPSGMLNSPFEQVRAIERRLGHEAAGAGPLPAALRFGGRRTAAPTVDEVRPLTAAPARRL